jgi:hypothetical protein
MKKPEPVSDQVRYYLWSEASTRVGAEVHFQGWGQVQMGISSRVKYRTQDALKELLDEQA